MSYGNGTIERRGRDRWRLTWYVNAKRHRETITASTKREARDALRDRLQAARRGFNASTATVGDLLDLWVEDRKRKGRVGLDVITREKALRAHFGEIPAGRVTRGDVRRFVEGGRRKHGWKGATINRYRAGLLRAYKVAQLEGLSFAAPPWPPEKDSEPRHAYVEHADFVKIVDGLEQPFRALAIVAYETGCRRGELLALTWDRVSLEKGRAKLTKTKNGRAREIILPPAAVRELTGLKLTREQVFPGSPWAFSRDGGRITDNVAAAAWRRARKAAGLEHVRFHDLRHTTATNWRRAGVPEAVIMAQMGHVSAAVHRGYGVIPDEQRAAALGMLAGRTAPEPPQDADPAESIN